MRHVAKIVAVSTAMSLGVAAGLPLPALAQDAPAADAAPAPADAAPATAPAQASPAAPLSQEEQARQQILAQLTATGRAVLAENLAETARNTIRINGINDEASFRLAAALLKASTKLAENNPRYWQLLAEAELQLGDRDAALAALTGYRRLDPNDRVAQMQLIELYAARIETADEELKYLSGIMGKQTIPPEVRSHAGVMAAQRLLERGEPSAALRAVDKALELNPVEVAALDIRYRLISGTAGLGERAETLMAALRANPVRADVQAELGRLLAAVGLMRESLDWMNRALGVYNRQANADMEGFRALLNSFYAQLYIAGQIQPARSGLSAYLEKNPNDIDAWLLRLVIERGVDDKEAYATSLKGASAALGQQWSAVAAAASGEPPPATQPAEGGAAAPAAAEAAPPADPGAVQAQVKAAQDPRLESAFVAAASDMAWFELYFNQQPAAAATWVTALETVLPEDSIALRRLRGWLHLANGQPDQARQALSAIRDEDPLADLGVLTLDASVADADVRKASDDRARKLLQSNPSGLVGAMLAQALKDRGLKPEPHPDLAAVRAALQKLPRGWTELADQPGRFYDVRVDPQRVAYAYGEPMFALVTIKNKADHPLTIGDAGVIQPGLWFDADVATLQQQRISGTGFTRMGQSTVIPPRGEISQYMRVDEGNLGALLTQNPTPRFQITGWCTTNMRAQQQGFGPGLAGVRVPFTKKITRMGVEIRKPKAFDKAFEELEIGLPDTKMRAISLLAAYAAMGQQGDEQRRAQNASMVGTMLDKLGRASEDEVAPVSQWAKFQLSRVADPDTRRQAIESLLADANWDGRLLGLVGLQHLDRAVATQLAAAFAEKAAANEAEEPTVKAYAAEITEVLQRPVPTTQPADGAPAEPAATEPAPAPDAPAPAPDAAAPAPDAAAPAPAPTSPEQPVEAPAPPDAAPENK